MSRSPRVFWWFLSLLISVPVTAGTLQDEYYSRDIFRAIEEARQRTHHYDYSSALRYNRTTSQSIQIPRLLNQELAQTIIETPDAVPEVNQTVPTGASEGLSRTTDAADVPAATLPTVLSAEPVSISVR